MGEAIAPLEQLRNCFERANERLESLPECGLSEAGQPYIQEVADALQSFAAWFYELTFDECSMTGSAWRVHATLNGLDAIADWVGLNQSQQFAADIRAHVGELVEQSETLDVAVTAAFTVKRTLGELHLSRRRRISQAKRDAIDDSIQSVATLAEHLGIRLQRIALMTRSPATTSTPASSTPSVHDIAGALGDKARDVLQAMLDVEAFDPSSRLPGAELCRRAKVSVNQLRVVMKSERQAKPVRVSSQRNRRGGYWLTAHGKEVARCFLAE